MMTLPALILVLVCATVGLLAFCGITYQRLRARQQDRLETAFNRARYVRECRGN